MREPVFNETMQVALVVDDLEATMRAYVEELRDRPVGHHEFNPTRVSDLEKNGQPVACAWRLAVTMVGKHAMGAHPAARRQEHLFGLPRRERPGLHHVAVGAPTGYAETLASLTAKGHRVLLSGKYNGVTFAYLSTDDDIGVITEIFDWPRARSRSRTRLSVRRFAVRGSWRVTVEP